MFNRAAIRPRVPFSVLMHYGATTERSQLIQTWY